MIRIWVEFGKKIVLGNQGVGKSRFLAIFGAENEKLLTILRGVFYGTAFCFWHGVNPPLKILQADFFKA
ncbi:MAG: hypothetical protein IKP34_03000 [Bacteroidales bacterium]|nr:hypothetical protein [Bacteroidales bacterium]